MTSKIKVARAAFFNAMRVLALNDREFALGNRKSVPHADIRGGCLAKGLSALAQLHGVQLQKPLHIDSRGEFSIVALPEGRDVRLGAGPYGEKFSQLLNEFQPRCGIAPPAHLQPESGWCHMNHFMVERMLYTALRHLLEELGLPFADGDKVVFMDSKESCPSHAFLERGQACEVKFTNGSALCVTDNTLNETVHLWRGRFLPLKDFKAIQVSKHPDIEGTLSGTILELDGSATPSEAVSDVPVTGLYRDLAVTPDTLYFLV